MSDAAKIATILASLIVLAIIALMVEGVIVGRELEEDAINGCCCGRGPNHGQWYAAPTSQRCATNYAHVAGLCGARKCAAPGS